GSNNVTRMEVLQTLSVALGLAALSGYSLYLTVFASGLAIHCGWVHLAPQIESLSVLGDPAVLIVSGFLFTIEFFADKIPWVDSISDAVHTFIRPIGGAFLATRALGHTDPVFEVIVALLGGAMSFTSHSLKAGTRLLVNSSPEPFSNIAVSSAENVLVVTGVALLWKHPVAVFSFFAVVFALTIYFLPRLWRSITTSLWFISRKLNQVPEKEAQEQLPTRLPATYDVSFTKLSGDSTKMDWAVPCVSGKGKYLEPNRFGYLVATSETPVKVYFCTKRNLFGGASKVLEIDPVKSCLEQRMLFAELHLTAIAKNRRYSFKFDRSQAQLATKVAAALEARAVHSRPLALA
ncbi:MAG TPA: DUF4126 domain-containing protein, partial [Chthoniobacterales bacterium]|nr:DUF4126 domain-containing protein [Chthoniobacterales bacterium]